MTQEYVDVEIAIGVCAKDGNIWAVTADRQLCLLCGRPPDRYIPLESAGGEQNGLESGTEAEPTPPASPAVFHEVCPLCLERIDITLTPDSLTVVAASPKGGAARPDAGVNDAPASGAPPFDTQHTASQAEPPASGLALAAPSQDVIREPVEHAP